MSIESDVLHMKLTQIIAAHKNKSENKAQNEIGRLQVSLSLSIDELKHIEEILNEKIESVDEEGFNENRWIAQRTFGLVKIRNKIDTITCSRLRSYENNIVIQK